MADENASPDAEEQGAWARPVSSRLGEIAMSVALLATAVFFVWQAVLLPLGGIGLPGPGFFPFALGAVLGLLVLAIFYCSIRSEEAEIVYLGHRDVLIVLAALIGVALTFEEVDTYVILGAFMAAVLLLVARAALWKAAIAAVLSMVAVWAMFKLALGVRLPTGEFWDALRDLALSKFVGGL
ncbi:MAG: tripartite tricarboxylate transporter TctB family protein [Hyphomonadaceae bacterium]|jgi:hypothetical protein|nr:tripartite tricarboxylate transporter TctB family protein [Hyphomonadaceae bacterium]